MDALALGESEGAPLHMHDLPRTAHEIHLDTAIRLVPHRVMVKAAKVDIAVELAVDAREQI